MFSVFLSAFTAVSDAFAYGNRLSPQNFNAMYNLASRGKIGVLREAVNRGLNIDSVNANGDTGLCVAVKHKDYIAYNSFRMTGANPRHACTYEIYNEYQEFLENSKAANINKIVGDEESLYYDGSEHSWWPWILLGGAAIGGGIWALSSGGSKHKEVPDPTIIPPEPQIGLSGLIEAATEVKNGSLSNTFDRDASNPMADDVVDLVRLLPSTLDNKDYLRAFIKVSNGAYYDNKAGGNLRLGDAAVAIAAYDENSSGRNNGRITIEARNGAIGMSASNGAKIENNSDKSNDVSNGNIDIVFKGSRAGDAVIGMYADTHSKAVNNGRITGRTSQVPSGSGDTTTEDTSDRLVEDDDEEDILKTSPNSGTVVGMAVFDFYTGTDLSKNTVTAENRGVIDLSAGYNGATDVAVNLVGMGSYIDDKFLEGSHNPAYAEKMELNNYGDIKLSYRDLFNVTEGALKYGTGGLIGIRADAQTEASNAGNIIIDLTNASVVTAADNAAGMLSVHGGKLSNETNGVIRVMQEAPSGVGGDVKGITYGMLAAKGSGTQTRVYDWGTPMLLNRGLIDMQTSNSYGMATFAGGDVINEGIINLGVENGQSYYSGNYGIYAAGGTNTTVANLVNRGKINVYSRDSYAIFNDYSGSVTLSNDGDVYISNKAVGSEVFGGNFSKAVNNGNIVYKIGKSEDFSYPSDLRPGDTGYNVAVAPVGAAVSVSSDNNTTHQHFVNEKGATLTIGGKMDPANLEYGGTYGVTGVQVSNQGSAENKGQIILERYEHDTSQLNTGMWLDETTTAESNIYNSGKITVNANYSIAMRNDSQKGASATNFGTIDVNGFGSYGMAATEKDAKIFNGRNDFAIGDNVINVNSGAAMYLKNGQAYNYGTIYLNDSGTTAFILDGSDSEVRAEGDIVYKSNLSDVTFYWATNGASKGFSDDLYDVDGYTLGKATTGSSGGTVSLTSGSVANVHGKNSHLFVGDGNGSLVQSEGVVNVTDNATAIKVSNGAEAKLMGYSSRLNVSDINSTGIYATGSGTEVNTTFGTAVTVNSGVGINADELAVVNNGGTIDVTNGVGIAVSGRYVDESTTANNTGLINVNSGSGVIVQQGAVFNNQGGNISVSGSSAVGVYNGGGTVNNAGTISVTNGVGVQGVLSNNSGNINVSGNGVGVRGTLASNNGNINVSGNGVGVYGGGVNGSGGTIYVESTEARGVVVSGGQKFTNEGTFGGEFGIGAHVIDGGSFINDGAITMNSGTGIYIENGSATNNDLITMGGGTGIRVGSKGDGTNNGTILIQADGTGVVVENGGKFRNSGEIYFSSELGGRCGINDPNCIDNSETSGASLYVGNVGSFINNGIVDMGEVDIDFDNMRADTGSYVVAKGGTYKADSFKGEVVAGKDIVMGGFDDVYVNNNSFEGVDEGLSVRSESYLFNASVRNGENTNDVYLDRKEFNSVVSDSELAAFFETNYELENNEKMYDALKSATTAEEFDNAVYSESGKGFYANLPRENMAVLRGLQDKEQARILEDGIKTSYGMEYFSLGKDKHDELSGFADDVYTPYISYGKELNGNWSVGGTLRAAYADSRYNEAHSSRNNKILMAFMPILYKNGSFKFLTTPEIGAGFGTYKRRALSGNYKADTSDFYYGLYNHAEYSVDMKIAELVTEAELNLQGASMGQAKEHGGLNLRSNDAVSLEAGIGVKLRKRIELSQERSLMLAIGTKYYHEFLDPYKDLRVGMAGSPVDFGVKGYNENKNRLKTTAEAVYTDGDVSVAAEISHNAEAESSIEGGLGFRYHF